VADPGAALVRLAHAHGVKVTPLVGPSALLLALMASGMNGQAFAFHGYLPVDGRERAKRLAALEAESERGRVTQMFIETPYRNEALFDAIVAACRRDTLLSIACDLTLETEFVQTRAVAQWQSGRPQLNRRPTVFLLYRERTAGPRRR
jgi:16S rRNA (cytidine1402-2'-O)-methyltransferase